jgi:hypothetical protein
MTNLLTVDVYWHAVLAVPHEPRASFHAAAMAIEAQHDPDMREGLLGKSLVNKQRMDTVAFSIGGALFHAVALSCEQNSPIMKAKLSKISNIYKQVIPMRNIGNLDDTSMFEVRREAPHLPGVDVEPPRRRRVASCCSLQAFALPWGRARDDANTPIVHAGVHARVRIYVHGDDREPGRCRGRDQRLDGRFGSPDPRASGLRFQSHQGDPADDSSAHPARHRASSAFSMAAQQVVR